MLAESVRGHQAELSAFRSAERAALSAREREVLRLLAGGGSYAEIGSELYLSPDTVRAHAQRAMAKLGAVREGVIRAERITWTGHVRDTVLFSILAGEWNGGRGT